MKIIQFRNGQYAIRRYGLFGYMFKDLIHRYWWHKTTQFFEDCLTKRLED